MLQQTVAWLRVLTVLKVAAQLRFLRNTESILGAGVATGYGLDERGGRSSNPGRVKNCLISKSSRPALGSPSLLSNGYRGSFPGGKAAGA
jgi:hypothetical protein